MNNIAVEQLFELGVLLVAALVYIVAHFACSGIAILISGQKTGIIRGFLQGLLLVGVFAISVIFFFNGKLKVYYMVTYVAVVWIFIKFINWIKDKITNHLANKKKANVK